MKFTVLKSRAGLKMTKTFTENGVIGYDHAKTFQATVVEGDFSILKGLEGHRDKCVIRGTPKGGVDCSSFRRKLENVDDSPISWVLLDYDGEKPLHAPDLLDDPEGAALSIMPPELEGVGFYWQLGSSAGVKKEKFSIHIWIELESPLTGDQIKPALIEWGFDRALASAVQVHYVAAPIFIGLDDPVKQRSGIYDGGKAPTKPFLISSMAAKRAEEANRIIRSRWTGSYDGPRTSIGDLLRDELSDLVTDARGGVYYCDCPRHNSESRKSLHIEPSKEKWFCHGCRRGGKTAYSLAFFVCNDDKTATKTILGRVRK